MINLPPVTRGERNNNPGNLRYEPSIPWLGLAEPPHDAGGYCVFQTPGMGLRAAARDLLSKWRRGLNTVQTIIDVYAPPNENNTAAYVKDVCDRLGVNPDTIIDLTGNGVLLAFLKAIVWHENGRVIYGADTLGQAVSQALAP